MCKKSTNESANSKRKAEGCRKSDRGEKSRGQREAREGQTHVHVTAISPVPRIPKFMSASESRQNLICRWLLWRQVIADVMYKFA